MTVVIVKMRMRRMIMMMNYKVFALAEVVVSPQADAQWFSFNVIVRWSF
jgi:hypothetical protein